MDSTPTTQSQLRVAHFNIQSAHSKKPLLIKFLQEQNIDICLLNETWFKDNGRIFRIPGYNIHFKNASNEHGGVAILIKPYIKYDLLQTTFYEDIQTIAISLSTQRGKLTVLNSYCPPTSGHIRINKIRNIIRDLPKPILVAGDFNAHHIAFGCLSTKNRGQQLYDLIDELDLCILNNGQVTTIHYPNTVPSAIDIGFASACIAPLCNWTVHDDNMGSYHFPTITDITLSIDRYQYNPPIEKFLYHKTDWTRYSQISENYFDNVTVDVCNPLQAYNSFCDRLDALKLECVPKFCKTSTFKSKPPAPWWNEKCEQAVIASYEALKYYRNNPTIPNFINYKKLEAIKKRTISEEKKNGWRNLCNSFNRTTPISKIWNYIKMFKGIKANNKSYCDEFVNSFLDKLAANGKDVEGLNTYFDLHNANSTSKFLLDPFTFEEFKFSLETRRNTTPGLDGFPYLLIKHLHTSVQKLFLKILNALWLQQVIPESWKTQCVIPILKPDKPPDDANSYRPISLSSCLGKIFENMIKIRLDWFAESKGIIPNIQFGFRRGRSCADSFVALLSDLKNGKKYKSIVCTFLDVQGAFDNVQPGILVKILSQIGIPGLLCKWIYNFLTERTLYVKHNNILYGPKSASKGTMQGATLSPLLYNLYTSEICKYVNTSNVNILQFADDLVLYSVNYNVDIAVNNVNIALGQLYKYYMEELDLKINPSKSSVLIFSKDTPTVQVNYNNVNIPVVTNHKFLGVVLDTKLSFEQHIKYISKNALKGLNVIRCLAGVSWGADPKTLSMLYKSIVRSHFDYSCLAYVNSSYVYKLDVLQNKALRVILGAMCSTPIRAMEVESKIEPLCLRRLLIAKRYSAKLTASNNQLIIKKVIPLIIPLQGPITSGSKLLTGVFPKMSSILLETQEKYSSIFKQPSWPCYIASYNNLMFSVQVIETKVYSNIEYLEFLEQNKKYYRFYTDGSKSESHVRSAVYDPQTKFAQSFVLSTTCSIFTAEAYAVLQAVKRIANVHFCKYFLIVTDSLSLIHCLVNNKINYKTNYLIYYIREYLIKYSSDDIKVSFMWVPSHIGITGNEVADRTACEGINAIDVSLVMQIPFTDCFQSIRNDIMHLWREFWKTDQVTKGKWYGEIQLDLPSKPWYNDLQAASRDFITMINRLRFGHSTTPAHLNRLNIVESSRCEYCQQEPCDAEHLIFSCPSFSVQRLILASELSDMDINNSPRRLCDLLKIKECFYPLYKYIKNTFNKL